MANILIGTPCYGGLVTAEYMLSVLGLQRELTARGIHFAIEMPATSLITVARNYLASKVLQNSQYSHLLFIDADIGFDPAVVPRYLAAEKDVVAGIYPAKLVNWSAVRELPADKPLASAFLYAVTTKAGAQSVVNGFVPVDYAATGFMLIRREALERMAAEHPELKYRHSFTHFSKQANEYEYALFDTSIDPVEQVSLPEDYTFCRRWRGLGGEIWADALSKFRHVGSMVYEGDFSVFLEKRAES